MGTFSIERGRKPVKRDRKFRSPRILRNGIVGFWGWACNFYDDFIIPHSFPRGASTAGRHGAVQGKEGFPSFHRVQYLP
jgi:hypothetical protein